MKWRQCVFLTSTLNILCNQDSELEAIAGFDGAIMRSLWKFHGSGCSPRVHSNHTLLPLACSCELDIFQSHPHIPRPLSQPPRMLRYFF